VPSGEVREERSRRYPAASVRDAIASLEQIHVGVGTTAVALPISNPCLEAQEPLSSAQAPILSRIPDSDAARLATVGSLNDCVG
jgi:hypothetical protein